MLKIGSTIYDIVSIRKYNEFLFSSPLYSGIRSKDSKKILRVWVLESAWGNESGLGEEHWGLRKRGEN